MISHALTIVINELNAHLTDIYDANTPQAALGNLAEGFVTGSGGNGISRNMLYLSIVNMKREKTLNNTSAHVRNEANLTVAYQNPPVFINFFILLTATHIDYTNALSLLSRAIRFFQYRNVFTQDNVAPESITTSSVPINAIDRLETFRLVFDLYSPTMEEVNHLWGTLGGKQYPFALYTLRMFELKFEATQREGGLITEVISDFNQTNAPTYSND